MKPQKTAEYLLWEEKGKFILIGAFIGAMWLIASIFAKIYENPLGQIFCMVWASIWFLCICYWVWWEHTRPRRFKG